MRKITNKIAYGILAATLMTAGMTGCGKTVDGTQTVATIDGQEVPLGVVSYLTRSQQAQMEEYYYQLMETYGMQFDQNIWTSEGDEEGETYADSFKDDVIDMVKKMYVQKEHAEEYGVSLTEEETAKIAETAKTFVDANGAGVMADLGATEEHMKEYLELATYEWKVKEAILAEMDRTVTEEESNQTGITMVKISTEGTETDEEGNVIPLTEEEIAEKKALAEQVLDKVLAADDIAAADMDALAKEVDDSLAATTPSFTTAGSETEVLEQALRDAALKLEEGEVADYVVEGEKAFYIVRLDKYLDQEATDNKITTILATREEKTYTAKLDEWLEAADVVVDEKVLDQIELKDSQSFRFKTVEDTTESAE